jgi:phage shock protein PspC (stress-responsive transcriptional regulator)
MTENPPQTSPGWNTEHLKDYRGLRRDRLDRKVAGVAGGLGRHLDVDPTIVRVLFVVLTLFGGAGLLLYGVLWLLVPEEGSERTVLRTKESTRDILLIAALVVAFLIAVGDSMRDYHVPWLVAGVVLLAVLLTRDRRSASRGPSVPPPPATPSAAHAADPSTATQADPLAPPPGDGATATLPFAGYPPPEQPSRPPKTGPLLFGPTLALLALALGLLGLYDVSGGSVADAAYPALALAVTGVMLVVGAFVGRPGGLILLGVVTSVVLVATAIGRPSYEGQRDLVVRPTSSAQVSDRYEVPAGRIELDLTRVTDVEALDGRTIDLRGNAGEIVVVVPRDLDVSYDADVHFGGAVDTPTTTRDGWGTSVTSELSATGTPAAQLDLDVELEFGHIELVQR